MKVLVTGGGTGGHIYPALSLIRELQLRNPDTEILYVGTKTGMEADIIPKENLAFETIHSRGFQRKFSIDTFKTILVAAQGVLQSGSILKRFRPDLVVGTGGYVAGPMILQAALRGYPTLIHEQNALPSLTNRLLARFAKGIAVTFEESKQYFPAHAPITVTGNPVRKEILEMTREESYRRLNLDSNKQTLLVVGGSRGAEPINEAIVPLISKIKQESDLQVLFITGQKHYEFILDQLKQENLEQFSQIRVMPYLYDMPAGLRAADIIISRSGGMIAEINACGLPAIYIPSPYVADNHQEYNAKAIENQGAAVMIRETELTSEFLWQRITELLHHPIKLQQMKQAALLLAKPQATQDLADLALRLAR